MLTIHRRDAGSCTAVQNTRNNVNVMPHVLAHPSTERQEHENEMLLERVLNVDYKAVFHISINKPFESLIYIIYLDDLNLWIDFVHCTEVNHFLYVLCASNNTTGQGPST